ncbi:hypothetical protein DRQ33_00715 [bacterium]|nr:MAG: hypothetical protein DRQ33_00715 [bacterium]
MSKSILSTVAVLFALIIIIGCGGTGQKIEMPADGVKLSYAPAVGTTSTYRTMVQKYIQSSEQGVSLTRLVKGDVQFDITVLESGEGGEAKMEYKFTDVQVGVFSNNQLQSSEEVESMRGLELTVTLDTSGSIEDIEGVDLEEEFRKEEISPVDFLLSFPVPKEKVTLDYSWENVQDTTIEDEQGTVSQKVKVIYTVTDFVMLDGARCIVGEMNGTVNITQKGETEQQGTPYEIDMTMNGDIKGKIYFDVDNGRIVRYERNKMIDVKGTRVNMDTGEKEPIVYYNQETLDSRLQQK